MLLVPLCVFALAGFEAGIQGASITVPAGGDLQAAIDRSRSGDVILLEPGATYVGNFRLPAKSGTQYITIRSAAGSGRIPPERRVSPDDAPWMPTLKSPNGAPALATDPGAHHWRLQWLVFEANSGGAGDIITLGDGGYEEQRDLESVPHHLILDGLLIRGDPAAGQKRGVALNSGATVIRNSDIREIKAVGQDSQAICGWNGPGPYLIENNYLEAAGENVMFGGADPRIPELVPSDITIRGNYLSKRLAWREEGSRWTVKNLFELKNARRVLVERNVLEHNWEAAQNGYAILFTPQNQDGRAPWTVVSDVTFRFNIVRHTSSGINISGSDYANRSEQLHGINVEHNLFYDLDSSRWGGQGRFLLIGNQPRDLVFNHNTVLQSGSIMVLYGDGERPLPIENLQFTNNLVFHNDTGILGDVVGTGNPAISTYLRREVIRRNVIAGGDASRYPADNFFPAPDELLSQFIDSAQGDYRLRPSSRFASAATDGSAIGAAASVFMRGMPLPPGTDLLSRPR
jgi:hypothetical protein